MAKDGATGPVSNMDGGTFKSSEEVRMEDAEKSTRSEVINEFGEGLGRLLIDAGFASILSIQTAMDEDLLAVSGIGKVKLAEIREAVGAQQGAPVEEPVVTETPDETPDEMTFKTVEPGTYEEIEAPKIVEETPDEAIGFKYGGGFVSPDTDLIVADEHEKGPESEGAVAGLEILDDAVVPSSADIEDQGEILAELADLVVGPAEPRYIQEYIDPSEDEDILPELADLEVGPPGSFPPMMPTVIEPLGASTRIARISQAGEKQAVEDARIAEAVRKNKVEQAEQEAELAAAEAEEAADEAKKDSRIAEVSEVLQESEAENVLYEPGAIPEGGTRPLTEEEIANEAPPENIQPKSEEIVEGQVLPDEVLEELEAIEDEGESEEIVEETIDEVTAEVEELGPEEVGGPEPDESEEPTSE